MVIAYLDPDEHVLPFHYQIMARVKAHDAEGARQAMREHLAQIEKNHERAFGHRAKSEPRAMPGL